MSFVNQYNYNTLTFSKEFIENNDSYIYSIGSPGGRVRDRFYINKSDRNGNLIWCREYIHSEMSFGEIELEMIQVGPIPAKENNQQALVENTEVLEGSAEKKAAFYGQYVILATNTESSTMNLLAIDGSGNISWTRAVDHSSTGFHTQKIVSNGNGFFVLSSEGDNGSGFVYQTISRFDSAGNVQQIVSLANVINANDILIKDTTLFVVGNSAGRAAIAELYSWDFSVQNIYFLNAKEDLQDVLKIEMNDLLLLAAKVVNGNGSIGIVILNRNESNLIALPSSNYLIVGESFSTFCLSNEYLYFTIEDFIYKIAYSFATVWKKRINQGAELVSFNMLSYQSYSDFLTASLLFNSYADGGSGLSIHMDTEATTCITNELLLDDFIISRAVTENYRAENPEELRVMLNRISYEISDYTPAVDELCNSGGITLEGVEQSSCLYLQAAGSTGADSSAGIHLRWMLKGAVSEHLPKGDFYTGSPTGLNRSDDFVKILRASYAPVITKLNLSVPPSATVDSMEIWMYQVNDKKFYVYFRNKTKYHQVRNAIDPLVNPNGFLQQYGNNVIEIEIKDHLFFASRLYAEGSGNVKTEVLSVETNQLNLTKHTTFRKNIPNDELSQKIFAENGRSVRFASSGMYIYTVDFEFYSDFITTVNRTGSWVELGKYSLSLDDNQVKSWLDPDPINHPIHAVWPRYNDGEFVNIENYLTKWSGPLDDERNEIKNSVKQYLNLSNDVGNPLALEIYHLEDDEGNVIDDENNLEISHLSILQMASLDYHTARMLGLGRLDFDQEVYNGAQYIYAAQYTTEGDLKDGNGAQTVVHLSLSLPTSVNDQRITLPVNLLEPVPGIISSDPNTGNTQNITDDEGYTYDGTARYLSLFTGELTPDEPEDSAFYFSNQQFNMSLFTYPVYVGIEYKRQGENLWMQPELPNDKNYQNVNSLGIISHNETVSIALPDVGQPAFVHREVESATHIYGSYGVNWFSRSRSSSQIWNVETEIKPANTLLPPSNINATLIQKESPLMFTSEIEQAILQSITAADKTFIRLTFDYDASQDMISYLRKVNGQEVNDFNQTINNPVIFADEVEIFFRPEIPKQLFGTISSISDMSGNPLVSVIQSAALTLYSTGNPNIPNSSQVLLPSIPAGEIQNYVGGVFTVGTDEFIIQNIFPGSNPALPVFHILKKQVGSAFGQGTNIPFDPANFIAPNVNQSFMLVENMQNESTWGNVNPHPLKVKIGAPDWSVHTEEIISQAGQAPDITTNVYYRKFRGINHTNAHLEEFTDDVTPVFQGVYKITFPGYTLNNHPQYSSNPGEVSVQWYQGTVRIAREGKPNEERKVLKVLRIDKDTIGLGDLVIYAFDESYSTDPLFDSSTSPAYPPSWTTQVNYYPAYRVYLYQNDPCRINETNIFSQDENNLEKYSIFGLRSLDLDGTNYESKISTPTLMFSRKIQEPKAPLKPLGAKYATRPDYFGRSTYAFTTQYDHKPFSVTFLRTNDDILLSSLYKQTKYGEAIETDSLQDIQVKNNDSFINDRLLDLANVTIDSSYLFKEYNGYRLPIPNSEQLFININLFIQEHNSYFNVNVPPISPADIINMDISVIPSDAQGRYGELKFYDFVKQTIQNSYVPLTEIPIIYQHIKSGNYQPIPKSQVIRDRNGTLLSTSSPDFDMAPMAKVLGTAPHKTLFVDFTLDGNSKSVYFYAVKESNSQMEQSGLSPAVGPVRLVNSYPVKTPEIKSVIPVFENSVLGISSKMEVKINSYDSIHNVKKVKLYRALNMADAMSIRSMKLIKEVNLEDEGMLNNELWTIVDDFSDLPEVPFSDPLYYRVTVEVEIEYAEAQYTGQTLVIVTDYAPSEVSKLMVTAITENVLPDSPVLSYTAFAQSGQNILTEVKFTWEKQAYKAKYHLYKMNNQGNWKKIASIQTNDEMISLYLSDTDEPGDLIVQNAEGNPIYHHFKVMTENTAGMMSVQENILTIGNDLLNLIEDDSNLARYRPYFTTQDLSRDHNLLLPPYIFYNPAGGQGDNTGGYDMNNGEAIGFWKRMPDVYLILPEINTDIKKNPHIYNLRTKEFGCYYSYTRIWDGSVSGSSHHFLKNSIKKARKTGASECIVNLGNDSVFVDKNIDILKVALLSGNDKGMRKISLIVNNVISHYTREEILSL
jgi:hypothetical protein